MLLLIEGGELYDPVPQGRKTLLVANDRIEKIGPVDRRALDALGVEYSTHTNTCSVAAARGALPCRALSRSSGRSSGRASRPSSVRLASTPP